jgi:type IV secretory pathway TraG/TraD family ATPase VirD4
MPDATLADVPPLLVDRRFRRQALQHVSNEEVRAFWTTEYDRYSPAFRAVVAAPLQNKIGAILTDPLLRRVFTGKRSSFRFRQVMDEGKVVLVNLAKGRIGEGPATILGSLLVSSLSLAALSRADVPEEKRRPFFVYLDEFHTFSTLSLATMLSELRKYKVGMVLANQYLGQLDPRVRDAVIANAGTLIAFRLGAQDARFLAPEFAPVFEPEDLLSLPNHHIYLRLMINGEPSRPFSASTLSCEQVADVVLRGR